MSSNNELLEALNILEREKNISKETLLEAIENSLVTACKNHFGTSENVKVTMDPQTCEYHVFQEKTVVEQVEDPVEQISLVNAKMGGFQIRDRRYRECRDPVQGVRTHRNTECQECHLTEDP